MNRFGQMALRHWEEHFPEQLAGIPSEQRTEFFSTLGDQAEQRIEQLASEIAGPDRPDEDYSDKLGRLREARMTAESDILRELILADPEATPPASWPAPTPWLDGTPDPDDPIPQQSPPRPAGSR